MSFVNKDFFTPLSGIIRPSKVSNLTTVYLAAPDQKQNFPLALEEDDIALSSVILQRRATSLPLT